MIKKRIIVSNKYNGQEFLKGLAQRGLPSFNQYMAGPYKLIREEASSRGIFMPQPEVSSGVGIFIMLRILEKKSGKYFTTASYADAKACYGAIEKLRHQFPGSAKDEIEGIRGLFLPGEIREKNEGTINELLIPYLEELEKLGIKDRLSVFRDLLDISWDNHKSQKEASKGQTEIIFLKEDKASPLENVLVKKIFPGASFSEESIWDLIPAKEFELEKEKGKDKIIPCYGSYNEWREITDAILKSEESYGTYLIASANYSKLARFQLEDSILPLTFGKGIPLYEIPTEAISLRKEEMAIAGFTEKEIEDRFKEFNESLTGMRQKSSESLGGAVHLTDFTDPAFIYRKNIFLTGLEAYTGSLPEDPIILDTDIERIEEKIPQTNLKTSSQRTQTRTEEFLKTVAHLKKENRNIVMSYSNYDTSQLKAQAKPSMLSYLEDDFEISEERGFFEIGRLPINGEELYMSKLRDGLFFEEGPKEKQETAGVTRLKSLEISASEAEELVNCPYKFLLNRILDIRMEEEEKDISIWLGPAEKGTLCHRVFASYHQDDRSKLTINEKKDLIKKFTEEEINAEKIANPPLFDSSREEEDIYILTDKYVDLKDPTDARALEGVEIILDKQELIPGHLSVRGRADLIESDGGIIYISDVKTGKKVNQADNDVKACLQLGIYCILYEQIYGTDKIKGAYLYPDSGREIVLDYEPSVKAQIISLLTEALEKIRRGVELKVKNNDNCAYCELKDLCEDSIKQRYYEWLLEERD